MISQIFGILLAILSIWWGYETAHTVKDKPLKEVAWFIGPFVTMITALIIFYRG